MTEKTTFSVSRILQKEWASSPRQFFSLFVYFEKGDIYGGIN